jgi:hypothetical protein
VRIKIGKLVLSIKLNDSESARRIAAALPFEAQANLYGDEIYFSTPVAMGPEQPVERVPPGGVAYWPPGKALCLFFGQTPYSPVNLVGAIEGDPFVLRDVKDGEAIEVTAD